MTSAPHPIFAAIAAVGGSTMTTPDRTRVIQGDEGCRDGHVSRQARVARTLREQRRCEAGGSARSERSDIEPGAEPDRSRRIERRAGFGRGGGYPGDLEHDGLRHWRYGSGTCSGSVPEYQSRDRFRLPELRVAQLQKAKDLRVLRERREGGL